MEQFFIYVVKVYNAADFDRVLKKFACLQEERAYDLAASEIENLQLNAEEYDDYRFTVAKLDVLS
jgi:hypothetical protein